MKFLLLCLLFIGISHPLEGTYLFKNGTFINTKDLATKTVEEHFEEGMKALQNKKYEDACGQFRIVTISFPNASLAIEATYYMGIALYEMGEFALANDSFTQYLHKTNDLEHFEDIYRYKLAIANACAQGHRRHLFNSPSLPRIMSTDDLALDLYNEIATTLPNHPLASEALLAKATFLTQQENYAASAQTYQAIIRRFPGTSYALSAYKGIANCHIKEIILQPQNVDFITLAEINIDQCTKDFPQASENTELTSMLCQMKNIYAQSLFDTAAFYERKNLPTSSALYYHLAATTYPEATIVPKAKERLSTLSSHIEKLHLSTPG